jgi:peroxiredoxin
MAHAAVRVRIRKGSHQEGKPFELHQKLQETPLVLVFYPGDW